MAGVAFAYLIITAFSLLIFGVFLYFVVKAAVRDGIVEARYIKHKEPDENDQEAQIAKTTCPSCGKAHDMDYPKCPFCKHRYP